MNIGVGVLLHFLATNPLILLILILGLVVLYIIVRLWRSFMGPLRYGRVISADHTPNNWRRPAHPLFSRRFLLAGNPDFLVEEKDKTLTPVEVKSTPWRGQIYDSHKMQLLSYCLLVEECMHKTPKHGIIMYGDGTMKKILFTPALREELFRTMQQMRSLTLPQGWHPDSRRCRSCSMRPRCDRAAG